MRRATLPLPSTLTAGGSTIASSVRLALLLLAVLLGLVVDARPLTMLLLGVVIVLALGGSVLPECRLKSALLFGEVGVTAVGIAQGGEALNPLLVCLPATTLAAGLALGYAGAALTTGLAASVLLAGRVLDRADTGPYVSMGMQWTLAALTTGLLAARIRQLSQPSVLAGQEKYAEAYRLLGQLRSVTRGLPGSLDPGSVARTLLDLCIAEVHCERGSVLLHVGGDQLVPLTLHGYQRVPWRASLTEAGPIQRAWLSGVPFLDRRTPDVGGARAGGILLVLPMTVENHRVGVTVLESRRLDAFSAEAVTRLAEIVERHALPLETASLFDELRMGAAAEERTRLAREMHDGIAQDLAFLGYELDALTSTLAPLPDSAGVTEARRLRRRITGLISDLRLSMTDLRSSVGPGRGLGAALSEYARSVGTSTAMTVHLSLTEGSTRLPADTEVQLLRIAHEAMTRARRRPGASNLWVTLAVDPPCATLVVEDDGHGGPWVTADRQDMYVDDERAQRIGAIFTAEARTPHGTRISVAVGASKP